MWQGTGTDFRSTNPSFSEDEDYAQFERIIIRPPRMSEIRHLINLRQTLSSDLKQNNSGQKEPSTTGDIKETQTERLKMFFERLSRGRGDGEVSVELGFWTGLANEVWQVSPDVEVSSFGDGFERSWLIHFDLICPICRQSSPCRD